MRDRIYYQPAYGPHLTESSLRDNWWIDGGGQTGQKQSLHHSPIPVACELKINMHGLSLR